jgi:polygalacturonase
MNYSPFIYAYGQENVAITGGGVLDGQCDCEYCWPWKGRPNCGWRKGDPDQAGARLRLLEMAKRDAPVAARVFGDGAFLRPQFIQPYRCTNVLLEGIIIQKSQRAGVSKNPNLRAKEVGIRFARSLSWGFWLN